MKILVLPKENENGKPENICKSGYSLIAGSISEAAEKIKSSGTDERSEIFLSPGVYHEKVELVGNNISLIGESKENTIIEYDDYALYIIPEEGVKRGTFRSYTMFVDGDGFIMKNVTIKNTAGYGGKVGQAVALYMEGDNAFIENCALRSRQDTLFTGPLPPSVIEPGGFRGPKENAPRKRQTHHYVNCYIEGDVDFIFGGAESHFEGCELHSLKREKTGDDGTQGYVTAAATPEGQQTGYVFKNCRFTSDCPDGSVYLGRPWRDFAKVRIEHCELGSHINPAGWHDWNKPCHDTVFFEECDNYGPGADTSKRPSWVHIDK
ncbi:MAG: pectin methylesterase [Lachnospiraceae bacterium]|nr:pectin methylesterase [Lachnospiraceae bacterium]